MSNVAIVSKVLPEADERLPALRPLGWDLDWTLDFGHWTLDIGR